MTYRKRPLGLWVVKNRCRFNLFYLPLRIRLSPRVNAGRTTHSTATPRCDLLRQLARSQIVDDHGYFYVCKYEALLMCCRSSPTSQDAGRGVRQRCLFIACGPLWAPGHCQHVHMLALHHRPTVIQAACFRPSPKGSPAV